MNCKHLVLLICLACIAHVQGQDGKPTSFLEADNTWGSEIIPFPVEWAPGMTLTGYEELRFAPQWNNTESQEFWSLVMGWNITTDHLLTETDIEHNLKHYFDGLMKPNHWATDFPDPSITLAPSGKSSLRGQLTVFDGFHTGKLIMLNVAILQKQDKQNKRTFVLIRFSPKPFTHDIWDVLQKVTLK